MDTGRILLIFCLIALGLFLYIKIMSKFKVPKFGNFLLVSGGVKSGKTTYSVYVAIKTWKKKHRSWKIRNYIRKVFNKDELEEPLLYSNIPLAGVPYCPVLKEHLKREIRFNYDSVIYICEASLVADSQLIKDMDLNDRLLLFNKLIAHELKGGLIVYDTQTISDVHYSIRRCLSEYIYIHHLVKWIPFFLVAYVREDRYSEDGSVLSVNTEDVEDSLKKVIIKKSVFKHFDCYCYSSLTDSLPKYNSRINLSKNDSLKANQIVSFREKRFANANNILPDINLKDLEKNEKENN